MSFFNKIYDISHTDMFKYVFHSGSDKVFVANVSKITNDIGKSQLVAVKAGSQIGTARDTSCPWSSEPSS